MYIDINHAPTYVATGGKAFDVSLPTVVFIHGSGLDHRSWALQTRWFAFHGYAVIAPDLPGHSLSKGEPLSSIGDMSEWLWQLVDAMGVKECSLVGHSQGALIALEAAALKPQRTRSISLIASGATIPVNETLLNLAKSDQAAAVNAMMNWGFGEAYQFGRSALPGQAPIGIGSRIMLQNPLLTDLNACNNYQRGIEIAASLNIPAQLILAEHDKMTPIKAGRALAATLPDVRSLVELKQVGHMLPIEAPEQCLSALKSFITSLTHH